MNNPPWYTIATVGLGVFALPLHGEDFTYVTNNGTITITGYTGPGGGVIVPDTISGLPVTSIGSVAFYQCTNVTSVRIGNSVITVGDYAFAGCISLARITMPTSLIGIGEHALAGCTTVTSVRIPDSVKSIGTAALAGCTSLTSVVIPSGVTNIGPPAACDFGLFEGCTSLTNVTFPDTVTTIPGQAFSRCTNLTSFTIPPTVTCIGNYAFFSCSSLSTMIIPDSVVSLGQGGAFQSCSNLRSVVVSKGVTNIPFATFALCTNLAGIYFRGNSPVDEDMFHSEGIIATIYYLPGTIGWGTTFAGRPTAPWVLPYPMILTTAPTFAVQTNQFGFRISWATNASVVVEGSTVPANPAWAAVSTNALTEGWSDFSDADSKNHPSRFYRIRSQ